MSGNIVFEGWLTKSPPSQRIWRTKWRRRWFALRQSGELPGQYFLDYYADRSSRRLKGTINLDLCEQVDAGLHMVRAGNGALDPKLRGSVFTIQTQSRTYHLEADCEAEMGQWVAIICRVCNLRPTDDTNDPNDVYRCSTHNAASEPSVHYTVAATTGPYIPISECITGVRGQDQQRAFTFDPPNIVTSSPKLMCDKSTETTSENGCKSPPQIKITPPADLSENESNLSDEDSLNAIQSMDEFKVTKTFTRLSLIPDKNGISEDGPPVPPRPPKTFAKPRGIVQKESFQGPRIQEPVDPVQESIANYTGPGTPWLRVPRRTQQQRAAPRSPKYEDDYNPGVRDRDPALQYYNLAPLPPAVDRGLKPRHSSHSFGYINHFTQQPPWNADAPVDIIINEPPLPPRNADAPVNIIINEPPPPRNVDAPVDILINEPPNFYPEYRRSSDALQYLDLDLPTTTPKVKSFDVPRKEDVVRGSSDADTESVYKTVDFLKTMAFNSILEDSINQRNYQH